MFNTRTYFDFAAGGSGNPSSPHTEGLRAKQVLEEARTTIARLVEVQSDDVIFTSGATESNALAIIGYVRALQESGKDNIHVLYLPSAHASIVENIKKLSAFGITAEELPIRDYRVDTDTLAKTLRDETALVSMDAVCGETGVVWNTREVADVLKKNSAGALKKESAQAARPIPHSFFNAPLLHVDASQAPLTEKISRAHFGSDILTFDASKVGTTRGMGALIAHRTIPIAPLYAGGGQERGLRPGSEAPELAKIFAEDLKVAVQGREHFCASAEREREKLIRIISAIPNVYINESPTAGGQAPNILNFSFPNRDTDYLVALLDEEGFAVSTRSACETDSQESSRAVFALTGDRARANSTLRISWGLGVQPRAFTRFAKALVQSAAFIDSSSQR